MQTNEPVVIKGCPRDQWDNVQAIQHQPFVFIMSNGSKWAGQEEDDVSVLLETLAAHELCTRRTYINVNPCRGVRSDDGTDWVDGPRLYECDGVTQFSGNFVDVSHVFSIATNHAQTIQALNDAINANLARHQRQAA